MAAGHDQRKRVLGKRAELQLGDGDVPNDMIDAIDRFVRGPSQRFRPGNADGEATGKTRARGYGDGVDVGQRHIGVGQSLRHAWYESFGMRP